MFEPVARRKLFREVADRIAGAIADGTFEPGSTLPPERSLMAAFAVGRPAVREALLLLEARGLVEVRHGRRTRVLPPPEVGAAAAGLGGVGAGALGRLAARGERLVEDVKEARLALEVAMARRAAERATGPGLARLRAALAANRRAIPDRAAFLRTDVAFHRTVAGLSGNAVFEEATALILGWLASFRVEAVHVEGANLLSHDEHAAIAGAIAARDPDAAGEAMARHQSRAHGLYRQLAAGAAARGEAAAAPAAALGRRNGAGAPGGPRAKALPGGPDRG